MKDSSHHLKSLQRKTMKSLKKDPLSVAQMEAGSVPLFKRPKTVPNKRKMF